MSSQKKLLQAIGPLLLAVALLGGILFFPIKWEHEPSKADIKDAATSMSMNVIKGNKLKNTAMASADYLPFFGSSELSRINPFHPSVLAEKYGRDYTPFLLGAPGTQSLSHFFLLNSMKEELAGRKIVFIISPQWFVKNGLSEQMFSVYYSPLQTYQWLMGIDEVTSTEIYLAQRLLTFSNISSDTTLSTMLQEIEAGSPLTQLQKNKCRLQYQLLSREDALFYKIHSGSKNNRVEKARQKLPATYDLPELTHLATAIGEKATSNNEFEIANGFYSQRIAPVKQQLKNSQTKFDYTSSPEFADFQLVLNQIAASKMDVLFVIPPVNQRWSDYTGLSEEMLDTFSKKMTEQLTSQGFKTVADYTYKRSEPYFMEDTIHLGWQGWLALDQDLQAFLSQTEKPSYHLDNQHFLAPEWQQQTDF